jgi:hypothetical protein
MTAELPQQEMAPPPSQPPRKKKSGCCCGCAVFCLLLLAAIIGGGWYVWTSLQREPEFYAEARTRLADPVIREAARAEFEAEARDLVEAVESEQAWTIRFTEDEINAWLLGGLEGRTDIPEGVSEPLIQFRDGVVEIGFRVDAEQVRGVVSLEAAPSIDDQSRLVIEVRSIRAGQLAIPSASLMAVVRDKLNAEDLPIEIETEPTPRLLIDLARAQEQEPRVTLRRVAVSDGAIEIAGEPAPESADSAE